jgi:hypothetical protein
MRYLSIPASILCSLLAGAAVVVAVVVEVGFALWYKFEDRQ